MGHIRHRTMREIQKSLHKAHSAGANWKSVGEQFGITAGTARRIVVEGHEPKDPLIRYVLGLPALLPAPACIKCGEVHVTRRCTKTTGRKTPRRVAIRCNDMRSAAGTILRNLDSAQVEELISILEVENGNNE